MELQVRIAYETAEMLELLMNHYQNENGINFSKGEVLSKVIVDTYDDWEEIDWAKTMNLPIQLDENYKINSGSLRPKFQLSNNIQSKIEELRTIIKRSVGARSVTIGAAIKFVLRQTIAEIQSQNTVSVESVINDTLDSCLAKNPSEEVSQSLKKYTNQLLTKLEVNDLL